MPMRTVNPTEMLFIPPRLKSICGPTMKGM